MPLELRNCLLNICKQHHRETEPRLIFNMQRNRQYQHLMLKEIYEQPDVLAETLEKYVDRNQLRDSTCAPIREWLHGARHGIAIAASGSSRHAGMIAEILLEDLCDVAVDVEYASEYYCRPERSHDKPSSIVISQSGETADTLAALRRANGAGHDTLAITNLASSTMAREATVSFPTLAGREHAIPATKSFTAQVLNLGLLSLIAADSFGTIREPDLSKFLADLLDAPKLAKRQLAGWEKAARGFANHLRGTKNMLFLGRGIHYPIACEGALKLKESAYLHAEAYPSGELKHGPNALVSRETPLLIIATVDQSDPGSVKRYEKTLRLMRDMRKQGAEILAIANLGDHEVAATANHSFFVEESSDFVQSICEVIPLQLLAYYMAINNGIDVDNPRNLAKAVLAE